MENSTANSTADDGESDSFVTREDDPDKDMSLALNLVSVFSSTLSILGSGTILYLANGGKAFPKERIEVFANDAVLQ
jgi:hypothetical protein